MKKLILLLLLNTVILFAQDKDIIYFVYPSEGQVYQSDYFGFANVPWYLGIASGFVFLDWGCYLTNSNNISTFQHGGNGVWEVTKAGNYKIQGWGRVMDMYGIPYEKRTNQLNIIIQDTYPPSIPSNLQASRSNNNSPLLTWESNRPRDFEKYRLYRKLTSEQDWVVINEPTSPSYEDRTQMWPSSGYTHGIQYKVSAVDINENESATCSPLTVTVDGYGIEKKNSDLNWSFTTKLEQNYPNPFNPTTNISYEIKEGGTVSLIVYDLLGNEIVKLVNKAQEPGQYSALFDASNLSSGVYIYILKTNNFQLNRKLTLIK